MKQDRETRGTKKKGGSKEGKHGKGQQQEAYEPETSQVEKKRLMVADELAKVEQQIYDLETKYLEQSSTLGNAIKGYEGFLGGVGQGSRKVVVKPEDRLFSMRTPL